MKEYLPGDIINHWKILEWRVINPKTTAKALIGRPVFALIECQCCKKTQRYISIYHMNKISQKCNNCSLIERNIKDRSVKIGNKYGKLTVIGDAGYKKSYGKRRHFSIVQCDCGSEPFEAMDNQLQNGNKTSCGCLISKGEQEIISFLEKNNINYVKEYSFPDLISDKNARLRFDFGIINNNSLCCLIEFDGRQHIYGPDTDYWGRTSDCLKDIQKRDKQKDNYCKEKNIPLLRIPYWAIKNKTETVEYYLKNFLKEVMPNVDKE